MREVFRLYFDRDIGRRIGILLYVLPASFLEGVGLLTLVPLFAVVAGTRSGPKSALDRAVLNGLEAIGVMPKLVPLLIVVVFGLVAKDILTFWATDRANRANIAIAADFRMGLVRRLMRARWPYYTSQPAGRFLHAVGEAQAAAGAFQSATGVLIAIIYSLVYLSLALAISWRVFLTAAAISTLSALLLRGFIKRAKYFGRKHARHGRSLVIELTDVLTGMKSLRAMDKQKPLVALLRRRAERLRRALRREGVSRALMQSLREPIEFIGLGVAFYISVQYFALNAAELLVMALLLIKSVSALAKIQSSMQATLASAPQYWSMTKLLADSEKNAERWTGTEKPTLQKAITLSDISFAYGTHTVLDRVSLVIEVGKLITITGPSGAGKTTFADLITGLNVPKAGVICLDDQPISNIDIEAWRGMIGYVPQEVILFNDTIFENLAMGDPSFSEADAEVALKKAGAWEFVSVLPERLQAQVGERGQSLSGGQRQRLAIARALIRNPKLLILDEATSALDPESERGICAQVKTLAGSVTVLAITHRPAWINIADHSYRLENHQLIEIPL